MTIKQYPNKFWTSTYFNDSCWLQCNSTWGWCHLKAYLLSFWYIWTSETDSICDLDIDFSVGCSRVRAGLELIWIGSLTWLGRSCRSSSSAYVYPSTSWSSHKSIRIIILFNRIYYRNQEMNYLGTSSPGDLGAAWILCMLLLCFSKLKTKERHVFGWWMRSPRSLVGKVFPSFHGWANLACSR